MLLLLWLNTSLLAVLLLHYCLLGVIVATMVVVFSQVVKLSGGIASTILVDPSEISSVGYHLDLTETQARREPSGISKGTRGTQRGDEGHSEGRLL